MYRKHASGAPVGHRGALRFHTTQFEYHSLDRLLPQPR